MTWRTSAIKKRYQGFKRLSGLAQDKHILGQRYQPTNEKRRMQLCEYIMFELPDYF